MITDIVMFEIKQTIHVAFLYIDKQQVVQIKMRYLIEKG
jgi:hypothetical protein